MGYLPRDRTGTNIRVSNRKAGDTSHSLLYLTSVSDRKEAGDETEALLDYFVEPEIDARSLGMLSSE